MDLVWEERNGVEKNNGSTYNLKHGILHMVRQGKVVKGIIGIDLDSLSV